MATDPLKKYEIRPDLPPRHRLKNAGEALSPKVRRRINMPIIAIALVVAIALIIVLIAKR